VSYTLTCEEYQFAIFETQIVGVSICLSNFYINTLRFLHILEIDLKRIVTFPLYRGRRFLCTPNLATDFQSIADFLFFHINSTDFMYLCSKL